MTLSTLTKQMLATLVIWMAVTHAAPAQTVEPFNIDIPDDKVEAVKARFGNAQFPTQLGDGGWESGASQIFMARFADYMANEFDWRAAETRLNAYPQFTTIIDDASIHFYHVKGEGDNPKPLLLTHGWPGSVFEFLEVIGPLTQPSKYGGRADDAFTVVIPSLPGFGFSQAPTDRTIGPKTTATLWNTLMTDVLGYERYGAQGGDLGSLVTAELGARFPENLIGIHLNLVPWAMRPIEELSKEEVVWLSDVGAFTQAELAYFGLQATKPTTPSFALADSPMGTAAWVLEKFYAWSDRGSLDGEITDIYTMDELGALVSLYTLTDTIDTSIWYYEGFAREMRGAYLSTDRVHVPTGVAIFPKDLLNGQPPRSWIEVNYNLVHYSQMPSGGHFAALEEPELFVRDVRTFFKGLETTK